jgi:hypothetical protein
MEDLAQSTDVAASPVEHRGPGHHAPVLSGVALWTVEDPAPPFDLCFGQSVAAGDLDGDGFRDVIVVEGPCGLDDTTQGRIAIYRGGRSLPSRTAVWTDLDWSAPGRPILGVAVATGDVDGDHHDDLVITSSAGVLVYWGISDLGVPLGAPSFRMSAQLGAAALADVNGDRRKDLVTVSGRTATVWLATPGAATGPFTQARTVTPATTVLAVGDTNSDQIEDLVVTNRVDSQLLLGCRAHDPDCSGGLRATPAWRTVAQPVHGMVPDLNGDGLSEAIVGTVGLFGGDGAGRAWLYLSDRATGLAATPAWAMLGDSHYVAFGATVVVPGDLDGDHRSTEFVLSSAGRVYAFFPPRDQLAAMTPGFAWPRADATQAQINAGETLLDDATVIVAAGDVNRDHFADLLVGAPPVFGTTTSGKVHLLGGGRRPPSAEPPFLPGARVCHLPATGKPDLTVDTPALKRSMFVERVAFAPDACELTEGCIGAPGVRRLLRFATSIANFGGAPAIVPGPDKAPQLYHQSTCDGELELENFSQYELIDETGARIAAGRKQSLFMIDIAPNCMDAGPATLALPDQRLSPGWGDVYSAATPCNWLDTTDVPDGRYTLRVSIDTNHIVAQDDTLPDSASVEILLSGNTVEILP